MKCFAYKNKFALVAEIFYIAHKKISKLHIHILTLDEMTCCHLFYVNIVSEK